MDKEIEILLEANSRGGVIVEKDSHASKENPECFLAWDTDQTQQGGLSGVWPFPARKSS
jgi:hypothetical protein